MKWRQRANRKVVEAVVAAFRDSAEVSSSRLSTLKLRDWQQSYHWLDASGMALYFLERVESLHIESALPAATLARLRGNLADNRVRSSALFAEFTSLNESFQAAGMLYANLKGFSLSPESCPRPELRCQLDLDFLVDGAQLGWYRDVLAETGYERVVANPDVWEFKAGSSELVSINDHYKARPQRCVELHFASSVASPHLAYRDPRLERLASHSWGGVTFPALTPADQFVAQAVHIFKHLCSPCTRLSWLLEYQHHVSVRAHDQSFWNAVRAQADAHRHTSIAIGLTTLLSSRIFGWEVGPQLEEWTSSRLPAGVRLWAEQYGRQSVLADFPGTKLYLLLEEELKGNDHAWKQSRRTSLLPLHRAPRLLSTNAQDNVWKRIRSEAHQLRFVLFRLRFHVVEGLRYLIAASSWKRRVVCAPCLAQRDVGNLPEHRDFRISQKNRDVGHPKSLARSDC
jgi:Uncharacterised nucleotidyltransferase